MIIQNMFASDIDRKINGVIKVDQGKNEVIEQEVREYVITRELKKHFVTFFNNYVDAFDNPTADIGVWISGFFGSGKSHFLKMLSYILENRPIGNISTVELFREKFADDSATFMLIDKATKHKTETILFNIDIESSINKDKTAVLRVFTKMFFNHLGFEGNNLKVALLEYYIESQGKTAEFRAAFEKIKGKPWVEQRKAFAFNRTAVVQALTQTFGITEEDAKAWFDDKAAAEYSIARFVQDVKDYVKKQPDNYRLLFMADEVGQYVGADTDMLINLQSIVEKLGSECEGKVWVVCTGQEAIDEIIKVRSDAFSRIQARFKTRLSLSSSSVDEVIQKRILKKKPEVMPQLEKVYNANESVLRNLFSFTDSLSDIKGYSNPQEYVEDYPFVPYQFIVMQKVFAEIRKHGNSGKHLSGGERSMLSGFQEAAQKVKALDEYTLVPFYRFYDTVHEFLDGTIRRVIERCDRASEKRDGVEAYDVDVLKLLYLIRYIDDIKPTLDNIVILMADSIKVDKIALREKLRASLDRLLQENYIGRSGDTYNFLTDEEQDIQRDIANTLVDSSAIVKKIFDTIFGDIYTSKKYSYGKNNFPFDQAVDGVESNSGCGMKLKFLTTAADETEKQELRLRTESTKQAIVVLSDEFSYFENLDKAMQVRKYVKQRNPSQLPRSMQDIIRGHQEEATKLENEATNLIIKAIEAGSFYVAGERLDIKAGDAKSKIDQALNYLVTNVYDKLELINHYVETDAEIIAVLHGDNQMLDGCEYNREAAVEVESYLEMQVMARRPTSMADIQSRYQLVPYGWREIEIAYVVAMLIHGQKVTIKYGGETIQPNNPRLLDMLRKKSEIGKTSISKRQEIPVAKVNAVRKFLREYFDEMNVPADDDGLVQYIKDRFEKQRAHYSELQHRYAEHKYPDYNIVIQALNLIDDILSQTKDNIALCDRVDKRSGELLDNKEDIANVESFFKNQVALFDAAAKLVESLRDEEEYLSHDEEAEKALQRMRAITMIGSGKYDYRRIPELNALIATVNAGHDKLLEKKREEILEYVRQCLAAIHTADEGGKNKSIIQIADEYYDKIKVRINEAKSLVLLDGLVMPMLAYKDETVRRLEAMSKPAPAMGNTSTTSTKKVYKQVIRSVVFPAKMLTSEADIDDYVEQIRKNLKNLLNNSDGINLK